MSALLKGNELALPKLCTNKGYCGGDIYDSLNNGSNGYKAIQLRIKINSDIHRHLCKIDEILKKEILKNEQNTTYYPIVNYIYDRWTSKVPHSYVDTNDNIWKPGPLYPKRCYIKVKIANSSGELTTPLVDSFNKTVYINSRKFGKYRIRAKNEEIQCKVRLSSKPWRHSYSKQNMDNDECTRVIQSGFTLIATKFQLCNYHLTNY